MTAAKEQLAKRVALVVVAAICVVLVWRNLIQPARQGPTAPAASASGAAGTAGESSGSPARPAARKSWAGAFGRHETEMDQEELAALDPTLRLDLLEQTAKLTYQGGGRNIFQFYTPPPPKPVASPIVGPATHLPPQPTGPPPTPPMPLKFYGISSRPGNVEKRAFLTDGDDIVIGKEGDIVGRHYKIVRIGVSSLEWEDTVTHQKGQAPMVEE